MLWHAAAQLAFAVAGLSVLAGCVGSGRGSPSARFDCTPSAALAFW
jgi:hypothetical protein